MASGCAIIQTAAIIQKVFLLSMQPWLTDVKPTNAGGHWQRLADALVSDRAYCVPEVQYPPEKVSPLYTVL